MWSYYCVIFIILYKLIILVNNFCNFVISFYGFLWLNGIFRERKNRTKLGQTQSRKKLGPYFVQPPLLTRHLNLQIFQKYPYVKCAFKHPHTAFWTTTVPKYWTGSILWYRTCTELIFWCKIQVPNFSCHFCRASFFLSFQSNKKVNWSDVMGNVKWCRKLKQKYRKWSDAEKWLGTQKLFNGLLWWFWTGSALWFCTSLVLKFRIF